MMQKSFVNLTALFLLALACTFETVHCQEVAPECTSSSRAMVYFIGGLLICVGLVVGFAGWRIFDVIVTLAAFTIGYAVGYYPTQYFLDLGGVGGEEWAFWVELAVGVIVGVALICLLKSCVKFALFIVGAYGGAMFGLYLGSTIQHNVASYPTWATWLLFVVCGLIGGCIAHSIGKLAVMILTAFGGANSTMAGIAMIVDQAVDGDACNAGMDGSLFWTYFILTIVVALMGFSYQYKFHFGHEQSAKYAAV